LVIEGQEHEERWGRTLLACRRSDEGDDQRRRENQPRSQPSAGNHQRPGADPPPHHFADNLKRVEWIVNLGYFNFTRMTSRSITPHGYLVHSLTQCLTSGEYHIA
jgi:hypothetical protein